MTIIELPYGKGKLELDVPAGNLGTIILPVSGNKVQKSISVKDALERPVNSKRLSEMVCPGSSVAVVVSDTTRPVPTAKIIPSILDELHLGGLRDTDITIVFALGLHREQTDDEMKKLVGEDVFSRICCIQHDTTRCRHIGETSRGTPVEVMEAVLDSDIVVGVGNVEFHYYAGYSGGAKCILPGVSSHDSVIANHKMMIDERASSGIIDGPVRQDMEEAAAIAGLDFIVNVVIDSKKDIVYAAAGNFIDAHRRCVEVADALFKVSVEPADVVVVSSGGYPKDINLYQATKALDNSKSAAKKGGSIILVAECFDCIGNAVYERWNAEAQSPDDVIRKFDACFEFGGHKAALTAKMAKEYDLYLVSSLSFGDAEDAFFTHVENLQETLNRILAKNPQARVHVMPYGGMVLPM
jgi:nickel-dependent lactate racemase